MFKKLVICIMMFGFFSITIHRSYLSKTLKILSNHNAKVYEVIKSWDFGYVRFSQYSIIYTRDKEITKGTFFKNGVRLREGGE